MLVLVLPAIFTACSDKIEDTYIVNEPVYLSYEDLRSPLKTTESPGILHPGKIYFKDDYIFVNEYQKGIHVIDNGDPADPEIVTFIEIPGNMDLAIRETILYADSYVDLVAIDIGDLENIAEVGRVENAFPYIIPFYENGIVEEIDEEQGVITGWRTVERTVEVADGGYTYQRFPMWEDMDLMLLNAAGAEGGQFASKSGVGGSMARFSLYDDFLYAVNNYSLKLFDVSDSDNPSEVKSVHIGWNIETLFPFGNKLFIGSTTGMYIFSLEDPSDPQYISAFWHATSCDPVVTDGNYAYVTLRAGNLCGDNESKLCVISIASIENPVLVKEYDLVEPYGLGIDGSTLFVCDGDEGLKIFDATDPYSIDEHQLAIYSNINAFDVIPLGELLIMIGNDGLYQYDYEDPENITLLSTIPIAELKVPGK